MDKSRDMGFPAFVVALFTRWVSVLGALSLFLTFAAAYDMSVGGQRSWLWALALVAWILASYLVWRSEREAKVSLLNEMDAARPILVLDARQQQLDSHTSINDVLIVHNRGGDAKDVSVTPDVRDGWRTRFDNLPHRLLRQGEILPLVPVTSNTEIDAQGVVHALRNHDGMNWFLEHIGARSKDGIVRLGFTITCRDKYDRPHTCRQATEYDPYTGRFRTTDA